jgi:hypothetical protein
MPRMVSNRLGVRCRRSVFGLASACALCLPLLIAWMRFLELINLMGTNRKKDIMCYVIFSSFPVSLLNSFPEPLAPYVFRRWPPLRVFQ